jgi:hypothetical protein
MDILIEWKKEVLDYRGTEITAEMRPLTVEGVLSMQSILVNAETSDTEKALRLQEKLAEYGKDCIRNIKGFTINGSEPNLEIMGKEAKCSEIAALMVGRLMTISSLNGEDSKNLSGQSG